MMLACNSCGEVFPEENLKVVHEGYPYGEGTAYQRFEVCPCCGEGGIEDAVQCTRCGEYFLKENMKLDDNLNYMCDICYGEMYEE